MRGSWLKLKSREAKERQIMLVVCITCTDRNILGECNYLKKKLLLGCELIFAIRLRMSVSLGRSKIGSWSCDDNVADDRHWWLDVL